MTSFYRWQKIAFNDLDNAINHVIKDKAKINIASLILMLTSKYEISERSLRKRIDVWLSANSDLVLKDNELYLKHNGVDD